MSHIDKLIAELCSKGVEYRTLGDIAELRRGTSITKKNTVVGDIPVVAGGQQPAYFHNESNRDGETLVIAGSGAFAGFVSYWTQPIFVSDAFSIKTDNRILLAKYAFYTLKSCQGALYALKRGSGVPHVYSKDVALFRIPVPPLEVQREIVKVLDTFTKLEAELEAELEARRRQYQYYRNALLSSNECMDCFKVYTLGEIGKFTRGSGILKSDFTESGMGCIHYGQVHTHYGTWAKTTKSFIDPNFRARLRKAHTGDLVIATTSEDDESVGKAVAWLGDEEVAVSSDAYIFQHTLNPKYVSYFFQTELFQSQKKSRITGTKVRRISGENLAKIRIPIPPIEEQERIVAILDRFDALVNDLSCGLPAEIVARRKQYEHYRDRLLTFREMA